MVKNAGASTWHKAEAGITLKAGDTIKAGAASSAEISFFDGSTIELQASTEIAVSELDISGSGSTTIRLKQNLGKTVSRVKKLADPASRYEIDTPVGIAAVRGSTMLVTVDGTGKTTVANEHGDIRMIVNGIEYLIHEGMQRTCRPGQKPGSEVPIGYEPGGGGGGGGGEGTPAPVLQAKLEVTMLAQPATVFAGDNITYTYRLKNTGDFSFHDISISNNVSGTPTYQSGNNNGNSTLDPGETWIYTAVYTTQEDDPSPLVAAAKITAVTPTSVTVTATETAATTLEKFVVTITSPSEAGTIHEKAIQVTGNVNDTSITEGTISINGESHAIEIANGSFSTIEIINSGENTIVVTVTDGQGHVAIDTIIVYAEIDTYGMRIELTWDTAATDMNSHLIRPDGVYGDTTGDCHYLNRNPDWGIQETTTDNPSLDQDDTDGYGPENITLQQPGDEGNYQYMVHYRSDSGHGPATATVRVWINDTKITEMSKSLENEDLWYCADIEWPSGNVKEIAPGIAIDKTADPLTVHAGDSIAYLYTVTNTGDLPLGNINISDSRLENITFAGGDDNEDSILDLEETWIYTAGHTADIDDPDLLENTANVSGADNLERTVTASDSAGVVILKPGITIIKNAEPLAVHAGDNITYTYTVTNTGNTPLADVSLIDDRIDNIVFSGGDSNGDSLLNTEETWVFTASHIADIQDPSLLENTVIVSGMDILELEVMDSDTASVEILKPFIAIDITADPTMAHNGDNITYRYDVTNTGNTPLSDITVLDDQLGSISYMSGDSDEDSLLDVEETWIYSIVYRVKCSDLSPLVNIVIVSGQDELFQIVTATDSATVAILQ